nr:ATP-binding protein [Maliibacterium massiliense]
MANPLLREVLAQYEARRSQAYAEAQARRRQAYARVPALRDIDADIAGAGRAAVQATLSGALSRQAAQQAMNETIVRLRARQVQLLQQAGLPADALAVHYACPACQDTGYVRAADDTTRVPCACLRRALVQAACRGALVHLDEEARFENYDVELFADIPLEGERDTQRSYMRRLLAYAQAFVRDFPHTRADNLIFCGRTGVGKTYVCQCIARALLERGFSVANPTAYQLMEVMRLHHRGDEEASARFNAMIAVDLLVVDDLGAEPLLNNVNLEYFFTILNERAIAHAHTLIATNLSSTQLRDRYGERITSRLMDRSRSVVFLLAGQDVRIHKKK